MRWRFGRRNHPDTVRECARGLSSTPPSTNIDVQQQPFKACEHNTHAPCVPQRASASGRNVLRITDSDINSLWSYGIVNAATWETLIGAWGFCERHAWVYLNVEMAVGRGHLFGPTIFYGVLLQEALRAFRPQRFVSRSWIVLQLRATKDCLLCNALSKHQPRRAPWRPHLDQARNTSKLCSFALAVTPQWRNWVCARCVDQEGENRCRRHLLADISAGKPANFSAQQAMLQQLAAQIAHYERSFTPKFHESATDEDRAALIAAIGWRSGWAPLLGLLG
jgi:hypothetical protein